MTVEAIEEREVVADEIERYLGGVAGQAFYPVDLVAIFQKQGKQGSIVLSAIWQLIDEHRIELNNRLEVVAFAPTR